ncbi:hypothetical protein FHW03_005175 [Ochrobactrum sp. RH2CCR150]|nr:hypothetical protein [Ochrobactrum sp. RH2CCR150]
MKTSLEVADIFHAAGPEYRIAHAGHLSLDQLKVMSADRELPHRSAWRACRSL